MRVNVKVFCVGKCLIYKNNPKRMIAVECWSIFGTMFLCCKKIFDLGKDTPGERDGKKASVKWSIENRLKR